MCNGSMHQLRYALNCLLHRTVLGLKSNRSGGLIHAFYANRSVAIFMVFCFYCTTISKFSLNVNRMGQANSTT